MAEGVYSDPHFCEPFSVLWDEPFLLLEGVEELRVDVPLCRVLWYSEDLSLEFALLLFRVDSFDLCELHDTFPPWEVPQIVDAPLRDARVDAFLTGQRVRDVLEVEVALCVCAPADADGAGPVPVSVDGILYLVFCILYFV